MESIGHPRSGGEIRGIAVVGEDPLEYILRRIYLVRSLTTRRCRRCSDGACPPALSCSVDRLVEAAYTAVCSERINYFG